MSNNGRRGWPEPQPIRSELPAVPPLDITLLPHDIGGWLRDVAERAQVPLDLPASAAMAGLSAAIGRRITIQPKQQDPWRVVPNLWGALVAPPGWLKSPMMHEALRPLRRLESEALERHKAALVEYAKEKARKEIEKAKLKKAAIRGDQADLERFLESASVEDSPAKRRDLCGRRYFTAKGARSLT